MHSTCILTVLNPINFLTMADQKRVDARYHFDEDVHLKIRKHRALMESQSEKYVTMEAAINDYIRQTKQPKSIGQLKVA